jgi:hypothetical protein
VTVKTLVILLSLRDSPSLAANDVTSQQRIVTETPRARVRTLSSHLGPAPKQSNDTNDCDESFDDDGSDGSSLEKTGTRRPSPAAMSAWTILMTFSRQHKRPTPMKKAKQDAPTYDNDRSDKNFGWATQK